MHVVNKEMLLPENGGFPIGRCRYVDDRWTAWLHARMATTQTPTDAPIASRSTPATGGKEPLQVRIPTAVKRRFKAHAAMLGLQPNELFCEVWDHYERTRPTAAAPGDTAQ